MTLSNKVELLVTCGVLICVSTSTAQAQAVISFSDQTASSGLIAMYQPSAFQKSLEVGGLAVGDFDNDGWQDLFVLSGYAGGLADHLFMNNGDGTFTDEGVSWGLTEVHNGKGIGVADYDGDGWLDVYITSNGEGGDTNLGEHKLYHNNGDRTFSQVATAAGVDFTGTGLAREDSAAVTFGDYDLDGDLDLFVSAFQNPNGTIGNNVLFRNEGDGTFSDATSTANLFSAQNPYTAFAVRFADMDGDFYPELLCVGDLGTSRYFHNQGNGTFLDITATSGVNLGSDEMGATILDYDNDGLLDWFVTDIFWAAINKDGNHLYRNLGNNTYEDVAIEARVNDGDWGWGAVSVDVNHDGWADIAHTNGTYFDPRFLQDPSRLFLNNREGAFDEISQSVGFVHLNQGRGMVNFDYDNDGDQDFAIASNLNAPLQLFRNDLTGTNVNWLRVFLNGDPSLQIAPNGYGATIKLEFDGVETIRYISGSDNHMSQSELSGHFGLFAADEVDVLTIYWPNLTTTVINDVAVNQTLTIDPPIFPPAMAEVYNDSGDINPLLLGSNDVPGFGTIWDCEIDTNTVGFISSTVVVGVVAPLEFPLNFGVLLIDVSQPMIVAAASTIDPDGFSRYAIPIPNDITIVGSELYLQGACLGSIGGIRTLTNGLKLTGGM